MIRKLIFTNIIILFIGITSLTAQTFFDAEQQRNQYKGGNAKYIFLFIGDGMGQACVSLAEQYLSSIDDSSAIHKLTMSKFPVQSLATTYAANRFITGSAASGTALATGHKTSIGTISKNELKTSDYKTIAEIANENGMKVGIVSTVSIDHATPAAFYAHQGERGEYYQIALQLPKSGFEYFAGGGFRFPTGRKALVGMDAYNLSKDKDYRIVRNKEEFLSIIPSEKKIFAVSPMLDGSAATRYVIDHTEEDISLSDFTAKGIELLENENGFFMMIEGGKIDWAGHANDAATNLHEVIAFDQAIMKAVEFYQKHPKETLIVVTADHETGGLALGYKDKQYESEIGLLQYQTMSGSAFGKIINKLKKTKRPPSYDDIKALVYRHFGLGNPELGLSLNRRERGILNDAYIASFFDKDSKGTAQFIRTYGGGEPIVVASLQILNHKAGIGWTTYAHTGVPVPVKVLGVGAELFTGFLDNTDIPRNISVIAGWVGLE